MRWKERFLVPDHKVQDVNGASFAGFYYICFSKYNSTIKGYYYHKTSKWYENYYVFYFVLLKKENSRSYLGINSYLWNISQYAVFRSMNLDDLKNANHCKLLYKCINSKTDHYFQVFTIF